MTLKPRQLISFFVFLIFGLFGLNGLDPSPKLPLRGIASGDSETQALIQRNARRGRSPAFVPRTEREILAQKF